MYGFLKADYLKPVKRQFLKYYCGQCRVLKKKYGIVSTLINNFDTAFMAFLYSLTVRIKLRESRDSFCIFRMMNPVNIIDENESIMDITTALLFVMLKSKIEDKIVDKERITARCLEWIFSKSVKKAEKILETEGFDIEKINNYLQLQFEAEQESNRGFEFYLKNISDSISYCFEFLAEKCERPDTKEEFKILGKILARFIYIFDNVYDYHKDKLFRNFNPFSFISKTEAKKFAKVEFDKNKEKLNLLMISLQKKGVKVVPLLSILNTAIAERELELGI